GDRLVARMVEERKAITTPCDVDRDAVAHQPDADQADSRAFIHWARLRSIADAHSRARSTLAAARVFGLRIMYIMSNLHAGLRWAVPLAARPLLRRAVPRSARLVPDCSCVIARVVAGSPAGRRTERRRDAFGAEPYP